MHQSQYGSHIMGLSVLNRDSRVVLAGYEGCADCCLRQPTAREGGAISHARLRLFFFYFISHYHIFARASEVSFTRCWPRYCCSTGPETYMKQTDKLMISFLFHTHI